VWLAESSVARGGRVADSVAGRPRLDQGRAWDRPPGISAWWQAVREAFVALANRRGARRAWLALRIEWPNKLGP